VATWLATKFVLILAMLVPFPPQGLFPGRRAERFSVAATPVTRPTASSLTPMATGTSTSRPARMSLWAPASFTGVRMTTTVTLDPSDVSLPVGGDAWITISIHDVADLYGVDVLLEFDPWVVEVLGGAVEPGTMPYPDFVVRNEADNANGTIWYAVVQFPPHEPASGSGTLARIHVRGLRDGATTLRFTECALSSPAGLDIPSTTGSSLVRVGTGTLVATRTPKPSVTVTVAPAGKVNLPFVLRGARGR